LAEISTQRTCRYHGILSASGIFIAPIPSMVAVQHAVIRSKSFPAGNAIGCGGWALSWAVAPCLGFLRPWDFVEMAFWWWDELIQISGSVLHEY